MTPPDTDNLPPPLAAFDYQPRTRLVFGVNSVQQAGELAKALPASHALLVTDPGIVAAGHAQRVRRSLEAAGLTVTCYDQVEENPSTRCVDRCVALARTAGIDAIVGLGGGSSMDTAKGCNFLLTNGGCMQDYRGTGKATRPMLPLLAIPTTGGTGSECQSYALITDEVTHQKMACGDPKAAARVALLDPALTLSQPPRVTACAGIDALAHAVETAVTRNRTPLSLLFSHAAFQLTVQGLPRVLQNPQDLQARGWMLLGAAWAGLAIEHSMLGAAHAAANPLTAHFDLVHGQAVGLMLPLVVRFNAEDPSTRQAYVDLGRAGNLAAPGDSPEAVIERLIRKLEELLSLAGLNTGLAHRGLTREAIPLLAAEAAAQWTATFNPRPLTAADFAAIYTMAAGPAGYR